MSVTLTTPLVSPKVDVSAPDRVQRLKDARTEALKEIEEYKKAKEAEFKAFEASVSTHWAVANPN